MNIEDEVKAAIEEFAELAYERFTRRYAPHINKRVLLCSNAEFLEYDLQDMKLKLLPELFAHDVKVYGDNAYLMWNLQHKNTLSDFVDCTAYSVNPSNHGSTEFYEFKRKNSAVLSFDIERAIAGDVIEEFNGNKWVICEETPCFWNKIYSGNGYGYRMKYPKRLKND